MIGRKGPFGSERARKASFRFWTSKGQAAATWLISRTAKERRIVVLMEIAHVLSQIGPPVVQPIVDALESGCQAEQADALFAVLRRVQVDAAFSKRILAQCSVYEAEWVDADPLEIIDDD